MKLEQCDKCGETAPLDSTQTQDWTEVEYKGRQSSVQHISNAVYCPACVKILKSIMIDFNSIP